MVEISWLRSTQWRQARALETGLNVREKSSRTLNPEDLLALPQDLRELFVKEGNYVTVCEGIAAHLDGTAEAAQTGRFFAPFKHDGDSLEGEQLVRVIRAALETAREKVARRKVESEAEAALARQYRNALAAYWSQDCELIAFGKIEQPEAPEGLPWTVACEVEKEFEAHKDRLRNYEAAKIREAKAREEAEVLHWIEAHGSSRLKALVREGIEWDRVYRDERLALERPGWKWLSHVCGTTEEVHGPSVTEAHLAALEEVRKVVPDARLAWLGKGEHAQGCACPVEEDEETGDCAPRIVQRVVLRAEFLGREIVREIEDVK